MGFILASLLRIPADRRSYRSMGGRNNSWMRLLNNLSKQSSLWRQSSDCIYSTSVLILNNLKGPVILLIRVLTFRIAFHFYMLAPESSCTKLQRELSRAIQFAEPVNWLLSAWRYSICRTYANSGLATSLHIGHHTDSDGDLLETRK